MPVGAQRYGLLKQYRMPCENSLAMCPLISENAECWWQGAGVAVEEKASVVGRLVILTEQISEDCIEGLPCSSDGKEFACNAGDLSSIPRLGRSPGVGNGNPLQYSYLQNPMDRGAWRLQSMGSQRV